MASPVLSVQKHTLTIPGTRTTVSDMVFTADTPPNVQLTSAGSNLPAMIVGERFIIDEHTTHEGVYEVVTVTTSTSDYLVESIDGATSTAASESAECNQTIQAEADLTGSPDITNCIPFVSTRVVNPGSLTDSFSAYNARAEFISGSPDKLRVSTWDRALGTREIVCEVTVVEFNPSEVNVYQGESEFGDNASSKVENDPYGTDVDVVLGKSFLYFTHSTNGSGAEWRWHTARGVMTDVDTLTFDTDQQQALPTIVNWYVAEAINTAWAVDHVSVQLTGAQTTNTATFTAVGDDAKTFVLGSYKGPDGSADPDSPAQNTVDVTLTDSGGDTWNTVTVTRHAASGVLDWAGFVVELAGNENVYRGQLTTTATSPVNDSIGATVVAADSWVHGSGLMGNIGGPGDGTASDEARQAYHAWTTSSTQVTCAYNDDNTVTATDVSWEVIEWDVSAAAAPRRVMVIS